MKNVTLTINLLDGTKVHLSNLVLGEYDSINDIVTSAITLYPTMTSLVITLS